ncbi:4-carboxymuconolactone decarboxylase [Ilyonectria robusta]
MSNDSHTDMFAAGLKNRREVVGNAYVDAALRNGSSEFAYPGQQLVTEYVLESPCFTAIADMYDQGGAGGMCGRVLAWSASSAVF